LKDLDTLAVDKIHRDERLFELCGRPAEDLMVKEPQEAKTHGQDKDQETDEAEMLGMLHAVLSCRLTFTRLAA
jgi:hypothetical protein